MDYYLHFYNGEDEHKVLGPFPHVQLTYGYLRAGENGDHIAVFNAERGGWVLGVAERQEGFITVLDETPGDGPVFSDVVIADEA